MPQIIINILDNEDISANKFNLNPHEKLDRTIEKFRKDIKKLISENPKILKHKEILQ